MCDGRTKIASCRCSWPLLSLPTQPVHYLRTGLVSSSGSHNCSKFSILLFLMVQAVPLCLCCAHSHSFPFPRNDSHSHSLTQITRRPFPFPRDSQGKNGKREFPFPMNTFNMDIAFCGKSVDICRFLSHVSTLTRDIDIAILSVCPSDCPSVRDTLVMYENGLTYRHSLYTLR